LAIHNKLKNFKKPLHDYWASRFVATTYNNLMPFLQNINQRRQLSQLVTKNRLGTQYAFASVLSCIFISTPIFRIGKVREWTNSEEKKLFILRCF